jgi:hypothetical protein
MTDRLLVKAIARALRAAADELERAMAEEAPRPRIKPAPAPPAVVDELTQARADRVLTRLGLR